MITIQYGSLTAEARQYWKWYSDTPIAPVSAAISKDGAGSEIRTPLMHFGTVVPVYLAVIRYLYAGKQRKGMKLLELGCGTGRVLSFLAWLFPELEVYGVDYSKSVIEYAKKNYSAYGVHFKTADTTQDTFFKPGMFDFVISSHVIEHIPLSGGAAFMHEAARLLKPGGTLLVGTPERRMAQDMYCDNPDDTPKKRLTPPHEHEYTTQELLELGRTVFPARNVRADSLHNPLFRELFHATIRSLRPDGGIINKIRNFAYTFFRDKAPKPLFDWLVSTGLALRLKMIGFSYQDILLGNRIEIENHGSVPDNVLLVCQKPL